MVFRIAICDPDPKLCAWVERLCQEDFIRRADECSVELFAETAQLLKRDAEGARYELLLLGLPQGQEQQGLAAAAELRRSRGRHMAVAFLARGTAFAYQAYRVEAIQYLLPPYRQEELSALLERVVEPKRGPCLAVTTAAGLRLLPFGEIEYVECTHHIVHFHMRRGEDVASVSQRAPFTVLAGPLLADRRFVQTHRAYIVNLAEAALVGSGELVMNSGARVPVPKDREPRLRAACLGWAEYVQRQGLVTYGPGPAPTTES